MKDTSGLLVYALLFLLLVGYAMFTMDAAPAQASDATDTPTVTFATVTPEPSGTPTPGRKEITLPSDCTFHSLYVEMGKPYSVLTFHCPNATVAPAGVGD